MRGAARILFAARVRASGISPSTIVVDSVSISGSHAQVAWSAGTLGATTPFTYRYDRWWDDSGYAASLGGPLASFATITTRAPSEAESWHNFWGGNSWVFFTIEARDGLAHTIPAGTQVRIWCPFVLDDNLHYSLTLAKSQTPIGPLPAAVTDNTFIVTLPAFTLPASVAAMGEIEGDR